MSVLPNVRFSLGKEGGTLYVTKPENGTKARASGYTRGVHGWGAEINLMFLIRKRLEQAGIRLIKKAINKDKEFAHMFGNDETPYLRTRKEERKTQPNIYIYDANYAIRLSSEDYNKGVVVAFRVQGDIFQKENEPPLQPDWYQRLKDLCDKGGIPCELTL